MVALSETEQEVGSMPSGRRRSTVEMLEKLVEWAGGRPAFCRFTGIIPSNLADYLNSNKGIAFKRLRRCAEEIFGQPPAFVPIVEHHKLERSWPPRKDFDGVAGVYAFFDSAYRLIYFGKASDLYREIRQTLKREAKGIVRFPAGQSPTFQGITAYVSAYCVARGDSDYRHDIESLVLRVAVNNTFNRNKGRFKRSS